ncbi:host cell division inhibitor Icd-like protein [Escherichia coli]|nr:ash family protein [Escherichia coli]EFB2231586.1 host cell division inhibitor Icd-like protein [Escherichia coli]HDP9375895.1 host cell division inhibitor Icd-like protein [Escherichia coli]HDP9468557.1 host cell division inhibitor Icd-like protein [Escherichia coli]HDP9906551.1 host cell division inhibitor Icd-like protein [Escherichia coli]
MCNALTVTKRESAPLPERLCERIAYCAILLTVYEADYSVVVAQSEGADHRYYSTPEVQNILLQNAVGHAVRKAKNFAGGATDAILSGRPVLINLMSDFVLDKTKATAEGRQWVLRQIILERITNNATFAAGGQCDQSDLVRSKVCNESFFLCSLRNFSRANEQGANLSDSCSCAIFLRRLLRVGDGVLVDSLLVILCTCKAMRRSSSHHGDDSYYSDSLALRRWRRLISPFAAVTKKPAVLSPGSLSCSISSITSCGILTVVICDFAFFAPVAISGSPKNWCMSVYAKKMIKKGLKCISPVSKLKSKGEIHLKEQRPAVLATHAGRLTTNDSRSIEVAMRNHTTHPQGRDSHNLNKYIWRFIALSTAQPRVIHIEATSEQEARQQSPDGCVMVFAARIRQEVHHA